MSDSAAPDADLLDDETPPATEVPLPRPGAAPLEVLQYQVLATRHEATYGQRRALRRLGVVESRVRTLVGEDGNNGRFSILRADVKAIRKWIAAVALVALGGLGSTAMSIFGAGEQRGAERIRLEQAERTIQELRAELAQIRADMWRTRFPSALPRTPGSGENP